MFRICTRDEFIDDEKYDVIFCFGAGKWSGFLGKVFNNTTILNQVIGFVDNDVSKAGKRISTGGHEYKIYTPDVFKRYYNRKIAVIITCKRMDEVLEQLQNDKNLQNADFYYIHHFEMAEIEAKAMQKKIPDNLRISEKPLIPKVIHYCWFGGNPIPEKYRMWMESWKKFCPDYEIKEWNESNYDITKNKYMLQAYEQKKWGFVPDYARLDIIYNHGGIYLDTDVEVIANFDELLYQKGFAGFEREDFVNLGSGFGAVPGLPIIKQMLDYYEDKEFVNEDGSLNMIASPQLQTSVLAEHGLERNGEYQVVEDLTIYPEKMFNGKSERLRRIKLTPYTHSIHHYDASWVGSETKKLQDNTEMLIEGKTNSKGTDNSGVEQIKVSVIVIVYNVEEYLEECVQSIRKQSYSNLEIILVDDGSTDSSGMLCDKYAEEDARIKVIHKKNEGLVSARQAGMRVATGEYVTFVDGDDWIDLDMYEVLADMAAGYDVDIVLSGIIRNFPEEAKKEHNLIINGYYDKEMLETDVYPKMMLSMEVMNHYVDPSLCNKLFRREAIEKVLLEEDPEIFYLGEDAAATYPCLLGVNSIFVTDRAFYHHRIIPAASEAENSYKREHVYERLEKFYLYLKKVFANSDYNRIMEPQLLAYYMIKLNQVTIRQIGVDFLQFYRNSQYYVSSKKQVKYELPVSKSIENCKIVLYGAGAVGRDYDIQLRANNHNMVAWIDKKHEELKSRGWPVCGLEELSKIDYDKVLIATKKKNLFESMRDDLKASGVKEENIVWLPPIERI